MLRTRLVIGTLLVALAVGVLVFDQRLESYYPFLFALVMVLSLAGAVELVHLLDPALRPPLWLCVSAVAALLTANWGGHLLGDIPWTMIAGVFAAVVLTAFLVEMAVFREPGASVVRIALTVWVAAYLGLLPCFLVELRWLGTSTAEGVNQGTLSLALAIFVPKFCDTGAYFTGRFLGRHPMAPVLSPKKTLEGAAGGLATSVLVTAGIAACGPVLRGGAWAVIGFGVTVGLAGLLGDLAESLIKRDCRKKDASNAVPGFGGVLDVVDSVLFAAPVAYCWLR